MKPIRGVRPASSDFAILPPDFLERIPVSRGNLRRFLEEFMFPPVGPAHQREAGEASARVAAESHLSDELGTEPNATAVAAGCSDTTPNDPAAVPETATTVTTDTSAGGSTTTASSHRAADSNTIQALAEYYDMDDADFVAGLRSVGGARQAAGGNSRLNAPNPDVDQQPTIAAFFDVDNTLIQGASLLLFARGLARRRFFSTSDLVRFLYKQAKFRIVGREIAGDVAAGRDQALEFVKGRRAEEVQQLAQEIFDNNISDRVWPGTKQLADWHLAQGHQVWLVTATPVQLAQVIARELGFTGALGTVAEIDSEGRFTGALVGDILHGLGKRHAVAALAAYEGLDLNRCWAYSDSANDMPMLSMVGSAVAVNPDRALRRIAKQQGWDIRDYRVVRRTASWAAVGAAGTGTAVALWLVALRHLVRKVVRT